MDGKSLAAAMIDPIHDNLMVGPSGLPYRPCAGVVLMNAEGLVFAGQRIDMPGAWQMPQGGIDGDETPRDAALRELTEETGVSPDKVEVLLFVDQSITNANNPSPRIDRNRIDMTMEKVGDRWLASRVEIL